MPHLRDLLFYCVLALISPAPAMDFFASVGYGYGHYDAKDLNKFLVLLERKTNAGGFNPYQVNRFDGHPARTISLGMQKGPWKIALEGDLWVESFRQSEVPFDLGAAKRDYRVTCADLRAPAFISTGDYGCVEAREEFNFLPLTLNLSWETEVWGHLRPSIGYGAGIIAGSSSIQLTTSFYGSGTGLSDRVEYSVDPGVNMVHKGFAGIEYLPWKWLGVEAMGGWRIMKIKTIRLGEKTGSSKVFDAMFDQPRKGDILYLESYPGVTGEEILLGTVADQARGSSLHRVEGDFTGWYAALKLNLYWRNP